jgi:hypothetical protein
VPSPRNPKSRVRKAPGVRLPTNGSATTNLYLARVFLECIRLISRPSFAAHFSPHVSIFLFALAISGFVSSRLTTRAIVRLSEMQAGNLKIYPSAQALIELTMLKTLPVLLRYKLVRVENVAHIPTRLPHVPVRAGCAGIRRSTVSPLRLFCQVIPCHMQWFLFRPGAASGPATARKRGDIKRRQFHLLLVQGRITLQYLVEQEIKAGSDYL